MKCYLKYNEQLLKSIHDIFRKSPCLLWSSLLIYVHILNINIYSYKPAISYPKKYDLLSLSYNIWIAQVIYQYKFINTGEPTQSGFFGSPQKRERRITGDSGSTASSIRRKRRQTSVERDIQQRIDRENRILLRKILEQHHGVRRTSTIPPPPRHPTRKKFLANREETLQRYRTKPTSNQLNQQRWKHKTDYENLLLLQKIQNAKPSRDIEQSFQRMKL